MSDAKVEVQQAVYALIEGLELFRDADPTAPIADAAYDFNWILDVAKQAFIHSSTIEFLQPLRSADPLVTLVTRVATLKGAIDGELGR
jgi:hypothetical protein